MGINYIYIDYQLVTKIIKKQIRVIYLIFFTFAFRYFILSMKTKQK